MGGGGRMTLGLGGPRRSQGRELNGCSHKVASFSKSFIG